MNILQKIIKEPLFHFLLIGAFIFLISAFIGEDYIGEEYQISIEKQEVESMFQRWMKQLKRLPTQEEFDTYVESEIQSEVLFREAKAMGLDKEDVIIKKRLVQKMEFLSKDMVNISPPTEEEAQQYFQKHSEVYSIPGKVDFVHVFFRSDQGNLEEVEKQALQVKSNLNELGEIPADFYERGDPFMLPYQYQGFSFFDAERKFGQSAFSQEIFKAETNKWSGPFLSTYGFHLLFITKREASKLPDYESVKDDLFRDLEQEKSKIAYQDFVGNLKKKYLIQYSEELKKMADSLNFPLKNLQD